MRQAFALLGIMTLIVSIGAFFVFNEKVESPAGIISNSTTMSLTLTSSAFTHEGTIPLKYSCDGENVSPELHIENVPEGTASLVLVMDDPDIPESVKQERGIQKFDHWALYNIPATTKTINEGELVGTMGLNSRDETTYRGPCPPDREHRYFFRLYAITGILSFIKTPTLDEIENTAKSMMLETTTLMGRYERQNTEE